LIVEDADRADFAVLDAEDSDERKVELLSGRGNLSPVRVAQRACVRSGVSRLFHDVIALADEDHVAAGAVGSRRHKRIEVLLLQVRQPRDAGAAGSLVINIVGVEGGPSVTVSGIPALDRLL
jgi:hypothetical protein